MLSRLVSIVLTLIMITMSVNLVRQSRVLAALRDQVAEMEGRLGGVSPPDQNKIWIKLVECGPEGCAWRLYVPPTKEYRLSMATTQNDGKIQPGSSMGTSSSNELQKHSMIRFSRSVLQGNNSYFFSLLGSRSEGMDLPMIGDQRLTGDAFEFEAFAADGEKVLDLDTPIPLIGYRVKEETLQALLKDGTIDNTQADDLRLTRTWYFGTDDAVKKMDEFSEMGFPGRGAPK